MLTSVLFHGRQIRGRFYVDHSSADGAYGPAGAFVVVLTWVYYLTRALADARGKPIQPDDHAVVIDDASHGFASKHEDAKRGSDLYR